MQVKPSLTWKVHWTAKQITDIYSSKLGLIHSVRVISYSYVKIRSNAAFYGSNLNKHPKTILVLVEWIVIDACLCTLIYSIIILHNKSQQKIVILVTCHKIIF